MAMNPDLEAQVTELLTPPVEPEAEAPVEEAPTEPAASAPEYSEEELAGMAESYLRRTRPDLFQTQSPEVDMYEDPVIAENRALKARIDQVEKQMQAMGQQFHVTQLAGRAPAFAEQLAGGDAEVAQALAPHFAGLAQQGINPEQVYNEDPHFKALVDMAVNGAKGTTKRLLEGAAAVPNSAAAGYQGGDQAARVNAAEHLKAAEAIGLSDAGRKKMAELLK